MTLAVAILTYKRPAMLQALLEDLTRVWGDAPGGWRIVVVDNDYRGESARPLVGVSPLPITYVVCPEPGVSAARNCALQRVRDCDYVHFLDDDQRLQPGWLDELAKIWRSRPESIVTGPVTYRLPPHRVEWAERNGCFREPRHLEGAVLPYTGAGNTLLPLWYMRQTGFDAHFDPTFGTLGGEDTELTARATGAGILITWASQLAVTEVVPVERAIGSWYWKRMIASGEILGRIKLNSASSTTVFVGGLARVLLGVPRALTLTVKSRRARLIYFSTVASGLGHFRALRRLPSVHYGNWHDAH